MPYPGPERETFDYELPTQQERVNDNDLWRLLDQGCDTRALSHLMQHTQYLRERVLSAADSSREMVDEWEHDKDAARTAAYELADIAESVFATERTVRGAVTAALDILKPFDRTHAAIPSLTAGMIIRELRDALTALDPKRSGLPDLKKWRETHAPDY